MSRIFSYSRVSTDKQTNDNQRLAIEQAGYEVASNRWFEDTVSGRTPAMSRPQFIKMMDRMESGDTLVCYELSRLGRDAIDVLTTVKDLKDRGIKLVVLQLGNLDLTSPAGEMMVHVIAALASMERSLLIERVNSGLARVKAEGKTLGRPSKTSPEQQAAIIDRYAKGESVSQLARDYSISRATVLSIVPESLKAEREKSLRDHDLMSLTAEQKEAEAEAERAAAWGIEEAKRLADHKASRGKTRGKKEDERLAGKTKQQATE